MLDIPSLSASKCVHLLSVLRDCGIERESPIKYRRPQRDRNANTPVCRRKKEATTMRLEIRFSSVALLSALLLCFGASSSAQIRFEDFSNTNYATQFLQRNGSAHLATYQGNSVLRLTDGGNNNAEVATVYFQDVARAFGGPGKQPVAGGFTTWFEFQIHNPTQCCAPGDGIAFIIQNNGTTDSSYGATGSGITARGAGNGGMGYTGISNNLAIEFDILRDPWDPNSNHIAIQTCGPNTNTPVHDDGDYTIGQHQHVPDCLYNNAIYTPSNDILGGTCNGNSCTDGAIHDVVIGYTPPSMGQPGTLQIWLDPTFIPTTHTPAPGSIPVINVPYNIVYDAETNPLGLNLDPLNGGSASVGFTASQPSDGTAQDILGWEFTNQAPTKVQQTIQPGGTPTVFSFGAHQSTVTYPAGFTNPNGILMTVLSTPTDRHQFYLTRLLGTQFANEQCIAYLGAGGSTGPVTSGTCIVYTYSCQDSMGNQVTCPAEPLCTSPTGDQCIAIDTTFYTRDIVTQDTADYLENDAMGSRNWMSIFTGYQSPPIDGTTSGGSRGFGGGGSGSGKPSPSKRKFLVGSADSADIVATFKQP